MTRAEKKLEFAKQKVELAKERVSTVKKNKELAYGTVPSNMKIDYKLLLGSGLFGFGWGWAGVCPGPAIVSFGAGVGNTIYFVPSMIVGMLFNDLLKIGQKKDMSSTKST